MINIVFFAALREQLGCDSTNLTINGTTTISQVKKQLLAQHPLWSTFFENKALLTAVNHEMVTEEHNVQDGDEVAFFPPVTGG